MTYIAPVLGVLAGVVGIADTIPYVRDTVGGSTRPHRGTWLIWSVLAIVVCLSQRADGAAWSLIMAAAQASLSGALAAGAVGAPDSSLLLYPVYFCLANGMIAVLIYHRRSLLASLQRTPSPARILG